MQGNKSVYMAAGITKLWKAIDKKCYQMPLKTVHKFLIGRTFYATTRTIQHFNKDFFNGIYIELLNSTIVAAYS